MSCPTGSGTVTFDGWQRWVKLQVSDSPGKGVALAASSSRLVGLMGSLFIRRRRAWVRVTTARRPRRTSRSPGSTGAPSPRGSTTRSGRWPAAVVPGGDPGYWRPDDRPGGGRERMSTADFAAFSDQAIMFAGHRLRPGAARAPGRVGVARSPGPRRGCRRVGPAAASRADGATGDAGACRGPPRSTRPSGAAAHRDRRPDRRRADRRRPPRCSSPGVVTAVARHRPGAGAVGQHVRVHPHRRARRRGDLPGAAAAAAAAVDGAVRDRVPGRRAHAREPDPRAGRPGRSCRRCTPTGW